ncbi:hypothetical protein EV363DRAFT_1405310 [Boletus edulis]|nr:hypothetical protein EV363DRAFT_1405310 [Boletus edulis]
MQALRRRLRQRSDVGTLSQMLRHLRALVKESSSIRSANHLFSSFRRSKSSNRHSSSRTTITKDHTQRPAGSRSNRLVRKTLLKMHPPVPLPRSAKRRGYYGWAMVDAGNFAIHILSQEARQKYFLNQSQWQLFPPQSTSADI